MSASIFPASIQENIGVLLYKVQLSIAGNFLLECLSVNNTTYY